ncbi:MAG: antitoxin [Actinomycetota bacterium]|nr:antitoxin [Actinomycetota bacterium]
MTVMVQIRNVPDELATELKARAAQRRLSLSDFLLQRLTEFAAEPSLDDVLERLERGPRRKLGVSAVELVDEARAE